MIKPEIYHSLGLRDEEYQRILKILQREPTITELAMFSVEWSEHCSYSRSKKYLRFLPREGKYEVLVGEDAGGIVIDGLAIIFKMESHNHPSQIEPKQGAATGVGGIIRDIFTTGARPIALMDSLRFGPLTDSYNKFLLNGVVDGIQYYGNCLGVPTLGGEIYFEPCYSGNCLVNVMSIGIAERNKLARARATGVGNSILYIGASTGRDGIGGCSVLASQEFQEEEEKRPSVQIGDPFMEKCLIEATLEAINTGDIVGIKDMGAGGLTCATSEMAAAGGSGIEIELQLVPRREKGMESWEVMISESQERMLACVKKGKEKEMQDIFSKWDLNAVVIGKVTADGMVRVKDRGNYLKGKIVAQIPADALANPPIYDLPDEKPDYLNELQRLNLEEIPQPKGNYLKDFNQVLLKLLSSPNIASKEWVYRQYDYMVQTNTVVLPGSDAAVLRLKGTNKAIAVTTDCNSRYCYLNPYRGAQIALVEAMRNLVCVGAEPAGITDCLNFANPEKPDRYWQFKECVRGITDACQFFQVPVVSGNVSFYNESPKGAIYPTPTIGMVGILPDINKRCTQYFKNEDDEVILLGGGDYLCKEEIGGSEYLKEIHNLVKGNLPELDLELEKSVQKTTLEIINQGLVNSAHDCSEGGLAVTLAECCISNREKKIGCRIDNLPSALRTDALLFGESQSRIILSAKRSAVNKIKSIARKNNTPLRIIGKTGGKRFIITIDEKRIIDLPLEKLEKSWLAPHL